MIESVIIIKLEREITTAILHFWRLLTCINEVKGLKYGCKIIHVYIETSACYSIPWDFMKKILGIY